MDVGKLIVIVAPSGSGKSTLIKKLRTHFQNLKESVSYTTRQIRPGEKNGENYFFIDKHSFENKIKENDFLEHALVHGNYYGTSKQFVEKTKNSGKSVLFDLDVQGCDAFKDHFGDEVEVIFIAPPSLEELEARLVKRGTEKQDVIDMRLSNAKKELLRKNDYDYLVINDDFDTCYNELVVLITTILKEA
ncbi:guanylate kinase, partial [bacterium]|nr:guanylate kinase [bacterium]